MHSDVSLLISRLKACLPNVDITADSHEEDIHCMIDINGADKWIVIEHSDLKGFRLSPEPGDDIFNSGACEYFETTSDMIVRVVELLAKPNTKMVDPVARTPASIMLINAISRAAKDANLLEMFRVNTPPGQKTFLEVEFKVNGVPVDFEKTANEMWERLRATHEADVLETAEKMLGQFEVFQDIRDTLDTVAENLKLELHKVWPPTPQNDG